MAAAIRNLLAASLLLGAVPLAFAADPVTATAAAPAKATGPAAAPQQSAPVAATPFDSASRRYEEGHQAEALVELQKLAEQGDARAQYLVGLDLIEGVHIKRDYAQGFAYILLATEDTQWGDLVAPRAREARAVVEPQLSGADLIHADGLVAAYKRKKK
jgi:TPR repeat protein